MQRHHSPDSTKVDAVEASSSNDASVKPVADDSESSVPPPPSKWEKDDSAISPVATAAAETAKADVAADAELVTSSA